MSEPYTGEIRLLPFTFAPRSWAFCDGQLLNIGEYTALYSILGNHFGGDGRSTFGLPNLQGRIAMGTGHGPGLSNRFLGEITGTTTAALSTSELPGHTHEVICDTTAGSTNQPADAFVGKDRKSGIYEDDPTSFVTMASDSLKSSGNGQPHPNIQPFTVINYCICLDGIYPSRN